MKSSLLLSLCFSFLIWGFGSFAVGHDDKKPLETYIVFVRDANIDSDVGILDMSIDQDAEIWHKNLLTKVCKVTGPSRLIYSYNKLVNGFAAKLTKKEVDDMSKQPWFVRAFLANKPYKLMTTYSPKFLQLRGANGLWRSTKNMGEGVIIGVLDTGVWPSHPSFSDKGMSPPPTKWKGHCDFNKTVCNNKLIGAKSFLKAGAEEKIHVSPFDTDEHGTHTASTAAGAFVKKTGLLDEVMGPAAGVAPRAHLAIYRVCSSAGCEQADIFKAMEEAVKDGVDVLSLSLGADSAPFYEDPVAIGGFFAMLKGVLVSAAGGNTGPEIFTISNTAPWLLTVAASSTDRQIRSTVKLGNGLQLFGESINQPKNWTNKMLPIVYLGGKGKADAGECNAGSLQSKGVRGKIVVCDRGGNGTRIEKGNVVLAAGGVGMILLNRGVDGFTTIADAHVLPASQITYRDSLKLMQYISSTKNPVGTFLFQGIVMKNHYSPSIASFSSRGPNLPSTNILKPDITGPGVGIVAAVPPKVVGGKTIIFDFLSGTSMSTPHLSGVAALVKNVHPNWSPAAIKSAIMTTAYTRDLNGRPIFDYNHVPADVFAMGSGHVDPKKAVDPGLIYDIAPADYVGYLCAIGYTNRDINKIIYPSPPVQCAKINVVREEQLNYPSIAVPLPANGTVVVIHRTVTNVGKANATFKAEITGSQGLILTVEPSILQFNRLNEKKNFALTVKWGIGNANVLPLGELKWVSESHVVRSPIAANFRI